MSSAADKFKRSSNGGIPAVATVQASRSTGVTSLTVDTQQFWPTSSGVAFSTYKLDTNGVLIPGSQTDWEAVSNGTNTLSGMVRTGGAADSGNAINDKAEMLITAQWGEDLIDGITTQHNQDGTHGIVTATSVSTTGAITAGALLTGSNGLAISGGSVTLPAASIAPAALATGIGSNLLANPYKFSAYQSASIGLSSAGGTLVLNTEDYDTGSNFNNTTGVFTAPAAGFYHFVGQVSIINLPSTNFAWASLYKNGTELPKRGQRIVSGSSGSYSLMVSLDVQLAANDTIALGYAIQSNQLTEVGTTWLTGHLVSTT